MKNEISCTFYDNYLCLVDRKNTLIYDIACSMTHDQLLELFKYVLDENQSKEKHIIELIKKNGDKTLASKYCYCTLFHFKKIEENIGNIFINGCKKKN